MLRRKFGSNSQNNIIIYQSSKREVPNSVTNDALGGWGANYVDNKSKWDSTTGIGYLYFDGVVARIPDSVFEQNSTMTAILYMPDTVTSIGSRSFYFSESNTTLRSKLQSVNFSHNIRFIGRRAFQSNRRLEKALLPNTLEYMYEYVFETCAQKLSEVSIGENFKFFKYSTDSTSSNKGEGCFGLCYNLTTVHWNAINCEDFVLANYSPFSMSSIGLQSNGSTVAPNITTVTFGDKVQNIPGSLFWKCEKISNDIHIPASVTRIGDRAFQQCLGIKNVYCHCKTPPKIEPSDGSNFTANDKKNCVFRYFDSTWKLLNLTIYVPEESVNLYKNDANWSLYSSMIKAYKY